MISTNELHTAFEHAAADLRPPPDLATRLHRDIVRARRRRRAVLTAGPTGVLALGTALALTSAPAAAPHSPATGTHRDDVRSAKATSSAATRVSTVTFTFAGRRIALPTRLIPDAAQVWFIGVQTSGLPDGAKPVHVDGGPKAFVGPWLGGDPQLFVSITAFPQLTSLADGRRDAYLVVALGGLSDRQVRDWLESLGAS